MRWVQISAAVIEVNLKLGLSTLKAWEALDEACEKGEVESYRDDENHFFVHETSLANWIKAKSRKPKRASRKLSLAQEAIKDIWPDDIPDTVTNPQIEREVGDWLARKQLRKFD